MVCIKDCRLSSSFKKTNEMIPSVLSVKTKVEVAELC